MVCLLSYDLIDQLIKTLKSQTICGTPLVRQPAVELGTHRTQGHLLLSQQCIVTLSQRENVAQHSTVHRLIEEESSSGLTAFRLAFQHFILTILLNANSTLQGVGLYNLF